jgi:ATP-dependent exoDNAse (exonuclease V) beta subunit
LCPFTPPTCLPQAGKAGLAGHVPVKKLGIKTSSSVKAMANAVLEKDSSIPFPHFTLLKASAGSGKTYSLTERFVQFLLSDKIPQNHLRNILAISFSNNAAKEMKERILSWLKDIYFKDPEKIEKLSEILSLKKEDLPDRAEATIDEILKNYTEFQVKTIDSFMTSIYKASAINLGYSPDFDIVMRPENIMAYAFHRFLRGVREKTPEAEFLEKLLGSLEGFASGNRTTLPSALRYRQRGKDQRCRKKD